MTFMDEASSFLGKIFRGAAYEFEKNARRTIEMRMERFRLFVFKQALLIIFFAFGFLCLLLALVFAGIEYLQITKTLSFLIIGIIALGIGIVLKILN